VSYERKHNDANGEGGRDGTDDNLSQSCGVEGETDDAAILARRRTLARSLFTTLFVSQGVPMIEMGDELWRTQRGNNNAYCHDSELTWVDWTDRPEARAMLAFARAVVGLRRRHPSLRLTEYLTDRDIAWLRPSGGSMTPADWADPAVAALGFRLEANAEGAAVLVLLNAEPKPLDFVLPAGTWAIELDTGADDAARAPEARERVAGSVRVGASSVVVLADESGPDARRPSRRPGEVG
jgi:glycogen operon protein